MRARSHNNNNNNNNNSNNMRSNNNNNNAATSQVFETAPCPRRLPSSCLAKSPVRLMRQTRQHAKCCSL